MVLPLRRYDACEQDSAPRAVKFANYFKLTEGRRSDQITIIDRGDEWIFHYSRHERQNLDEEENSGDRPSHMHKMFYHDEFELDQIWPTRNRDEIKRCNALFEFRLRGSQAATQ